MRRRACPHCHSPKDTAFRVTITWPPFCFASLPRPFIKLKENGRSNISRSSSSTSSFSSTAGESETLEEYDSVVGTKPAPRHARAQDPAAPHAPQLPAASGPSGGLCAGGKCPAAPPRCPVPADIEGLNPVPGCGEVGWGAWWGTLVSLGVHWGRHSGARRLLHQDKLSRERAHGGALMSRDVMRHQEGVGRKAGCTRESRVPVSPRAGKPAVYGVAIQAGRVCLWRLARQREPERGGRSHPCDHEQEPHRWVAGAREGCQGHQLCLRSWSPWKPPGSHSGRSGWGLQLWDGEAPSPALPGLQAAAEGGGSKQRPCSPWQDGHPAGCRASPHSSRNPDPNRAVLERRPHVLYFCIYMGNLFPF